MHYRLICIINPKEEGRYVEIEVCHDTGRQTLSPFLRRITTVELQKSCDASQSHLISKIFNTGQFSQPFIFTYEQLKDRGLQNVLAHHGWIYVRLGKNATIKKVRSAVPFFPNDNVAEYERGKILCGELYISDPLLWWKDIDVRIRYEHCTDVFPVSYTTIPYHADNNSWQVRDYDSEKILLEPLSDHCDRSISRLNLNSGSFEVLHNLYNLGWKIYYQKSYSQKCQLSYKNNKYGIEWFDTVGMSSTSDPSGQILESYLKNRNFAEYDGGLLVYNKQTIYKLPPEITVQAIAPSLDWESLYNTKVEMSSSERNLLLKMIHENVQVRLKSYQEEGVIWLHKMRKNRVGCMLADDMGLGKTLQVIAHLTVLDGERRHLVICPASIVSNWMSEINRFAPILQNYVEIISYDSLRLNIEQYVGLSYDTVVVDEGQYVKNDHTQRHSVIGQLKRIHTIILSGTPIENSIHEIWSQFALLIPQIQYLEKRLLNMGLVDTDSKWAELSRSLLSPFILRRTKEEVLPYLPPLLENNIMVDLSKEEREVYESIRSVVLLTISSGISGRLNSVALEGLLRLRQCCISTNLLPKYLSNRADFMSTKMKQVVNLIKEFIHLRHKVLVFSQFTAALHELRTYLSYDSIDSLLLIGATRKRQELIETFQHSDNPKVFCISLKTGGTGLNLTAADRVILLDDWWNPAVESQAFARAHRIGQLHDVEIFRVVCRDTIEEKILEMHNKKRYITDIFNQGASTFTAEQIAELLNE